MPDCKPKFRNQKNFSRPQKPQSCSTHFLRVASSATPVWTPIFCYWPRLKQGSTGGGGWSWDENTTTTPMTSLWWSRRANPMPLRVETRADVLRALLRMSQLKLFTVESFFEYIQCTWAAKIAWGFLGLNRPKLPLYRPKIGRPSHRNWNDKGRKQDACDTNKFLKVEACWILGSTSFLVYISSNGTLPSAPGPEVLLKETRYTILAYDSFYVLTWLHIVLYVCVCTGVLNNFSVKKSILISRNFDKQR